MQETITSLYDDEKGHCKYCRRTDAKPKRAFCKTLDSRLIEIAYQAFDFLLDYQRRQFRTKEIWDSHHVMTDFQKLSYWDIFRRTKGEGWTLTETGYRFLTGQIALPHKVWIRDWLKLGEPVKVSEELITVDKANPRWATRRSDWTLDYITRYKYQPEPVAAQIALL